MLICLRARVSFEKFLHKSNLPAKFTCRIPDAAEDTGSIGAAGIHAGAVPAGRASALAMSAGKGARRQLTHAAEFRCCCYLLPSSGACHNRTIEKHRRLADSGLSWRPV